MTDRRQLRIGYACASESLSGPVDAWRFVSYAQHRGIPFEIARKGREYDLVVMPEMADIPYWTGRKDTKLIFDMPDPLLREDRKVFWLTRGPGAFSRRQTSSLHLNWRKVVHRALRRADAVVCCTSVDADEISHFNSNVHVILDGHFDLPIVKRRREPSNEAFRILWQGMAGSLSWLPELSEALTRVARERSVDFIFLTSELIPRFRGLVRPRQLETELQKELPGAQVIQWTQESFSTEAARADLAMIPVDMQRSFTRSKSEGRLLLLWRAGLPVVTSATPAFVRAMDAAGLADYCVTPDDWYTRLIALIDQPQDLSKNATLGSDYVRNTRDLESWLASWDSVISSVM